MLLEESILDGHWARFALLVTVPFLFCVSLVRPRPSPARAYRRSLALALAPACACADDGLARPSSSPS